MRTSNSSSIVRYAFEEQCNLQLPWFKNVAGLYLRCTGETFDGMHQIIPSAISKRLEKIFVKTWEEARETNRKLGFYNLIKTEFGLEAYLWPVQSISSKEVKRIAQIRSSSHKYAVETGRWGKKRGNIMFRLCPSCCDIQEAELLSELPFFEPIIEDEHHVLRTCPAYHDIRLALSFKNKTCLFANTALMFHPENVRETARYVKRIHERRYPKEESDAKKSNNKEDEHRKTK